MNIANTLFDRLTRRSGRVATATRHSFCSRASGLLCALAIPVGALADAELLSEHDVFLEVPVVLSVTRLAQEASRAPAAVTVLDRETIEASGARTIPDVMRLVPGFFVGYKTGMEPVVSYHGFASTFARRLQVLVDGRSVYIPSFGGVPWSDLPVDIDNVERIEVIRGPNTASYGANAFLAIINIHTYHPEKTQGSTVKTLYGSHNERKVMLRHGGSYQDTHFRVTATVDKDDLYDSKFDERKTRYWTVRADRRVSTNDNITAELGYLKGSRGDGAPVDPRLIHFRYGRSYFAHAKWERKLGIDQDISLQAFHNVHSWDEKSRLFFMGQEIPINYDERSERTDVEFQHRTRLNRGTRLVWGLNWRKDKVKTGDYYGAPETQIFRVVRGFANLEWLPWPNLTVNAGAMVEDNNFTGSDFSPRLALNYAFRPGHTFRAVISEAIRVPAVLEERADGRICFEHVDPTCRQVFYPTIKGDPGIEPERILSREIGYYGEIADNLLLDVKIYRDSLFNLMTIDSDVQPRILTNSDSATISGIEIQADFQLNAETRLFAGYAHTDIDSADRGDNFSTSMPENSASVLAMRQLPHGWTASAGLYLLDELKPLDGDDVEPQRRLDLGLFRPLKLGNASGKLSIVGQSVLGEYEEYQDDTVFESRVYAAFEINF